MAKLVRARGELLQQRVRAVREALLARGVAPDRVVIRSQPAEPDPEVPEVRFWVTGLDGLEVEAQLGVAHQKAAAIAARGSFCRSRNITVTAERCADE